MSLLTRFLPTQSFLSDIVSAFENIEELLLDNILRNSSAIALFSAIMIEFGIARNYFKELKESLDILCTIWTWFSHLSFVLKLLTVPTSEMPWALGLVWLLGLLCLIFLEYMLIWRTWQPPFRRWRTLLVHLAIVYYEFLQVSLHRCRVLNTCGVYNSNVLFRYLVAISGITGLAYCFWISRLVRL